MAIAYRELRATDNPYDPRFDVGTVTVGAVETAERKDADGKDVAREQKNASSEPEKQ